MAPDDLLHMTISLTIYRGVAPLHGLLAAIRLPHAPGHTASLDLVWLRWFKVCIVRRRAKRIPHLLFRPHLGHSAATPVRDVIAIPQLKRSQ